MFGQSARAILVSIGKPQGAPDLLAQAKKRALSCSMERAAARHVTLVRISPMRNFTIPVWHGRTAILPTKAGSRSPVTRYHPAFKTPTLRDVARTPPYCTTAALRLLRM